MHPVDTPEIPAAADAHHTALAATPQQDTPSPTDFSALYLESECKPLPSADDLARYEAISPGLAEQFIRLYADATTRENDRADCAAKARERNRTIALVCAFLLAVLAGFSGMDALAQGDTATGLTLSGGSLSALVFAFLKATESR